MTGSIHYDKTVKVLFFSVKKYFERRISNTNDPLTPNLKVIENQLDYVLFAGECKIKYLPTPVVGTAIFTYKSLEQGNIHFERPCE